MNFERQKYLTRDSVELAQELLQNVNGLWRELTMKSKPRHDFVNDELSKLKIIINELREHFSKGNYHADK